MIKIAALETRRRFRFLRIGKGKLGKAMTSGGEPKCASIIENVSADDYDDNHTVVVMSFNLWHGGQAHPGHKSIQEVASVILQSGCHVAGLQELLGLPDAHSSKRTSVMPALVAELNKKTKKTGGFGAGDGGTNGDATSAIWNGIEKDNQGGIVARLPQLAQSKEKFGAKFQSLGRGGAHNKSFWLFNTHLSHFPYEPYEAVGIPYCGSSKRITTAKEALESAKRNRSSELNALVSDVELSCSHDEPVVICGDFNEPSCLDWIEKVAITGSIPFACEWPASKTLIDAGFVDTYRSCHPSPSTHPGYTWTPRAAIPETTTPRETATASKEKTEGLEVGTGQQHKSEQHDRIDFVYAKRVGRVLNSQIAGCSQFLSPDLDFASSIDDWPTDHQVVITRLQLS